MVFSLIVGEAAAVVLSSAPASLCGSGTGTGGTASRKEGGKGGTIPDKSGKEESELSSPFGFPAPLPLVPLLAEKDDDEDTKQRRKGWKLSQ